MMATEVTTVVARLRLRLFLDVNVSSCLFVGPVLKDLRRRP